MHKHAISFVVLTMFLFASQNSYAQEEPSKIIQEVESAEVFLEEYTDKFQETFFEALKQKGIENYDRAINLLLECKIIEPTSAAIDHELAKTYFLDKQYIPSQEYAENALTKEPENYWFLSTWIQSVEKQSNSVDVLKSSIPYENVKLKENLSLFYFNQMKYQDALKELKKLPKSDFKNTLTLKIEDSLNLAKKDAENEVPTKVQEQQTNPTEALKISFEEYVKQGDFETLAKEAEDATESYPLQPYFYYAHGLALNRLKEPNKAIQVLETALDYVFDDYGLTGKIYKELATAHSLLGNSSKANEYLSKVKSGS